VIVYLIAVPVLLFFAVRGVMLTRRSSRTYAEFQAGRLAWQLGLDLVEGDPATNLAYRVANPEMRRAHSVAKPLQVKVVLRGSPEGLPVELRYEYQEMTRGTLREEQFGCGLTVRAARPFPPFEVTSRHLPHGAVEPLRMLPPAATGLPEIDAAYAVTTAAPAMAELLGELLHGFAPLAGSGVHLVGDGRGITFVMQNNGHPFVGTSLGQAVLIRDQLTAVARRVGG
jgi:hypothetical protein